MARTPEVIKSHREIAEDLVAAMHESFRNRQWRVAEQEALAFSTLREAAAAAPDAQRVAALEGEVGRLKDEKETLRSAMMPVEDRCERCGGQGQISYPNTGTYLCREGGIYGQGFTSGTCNECWGTGSRHEKGPNLRELILGRRDAEKALREVLMVAWGAEWRAQWPTRPADKEQA